MTVKQNQIQSEVLRTKRIDLVILTHVKENYIY